MTLSITLDKPLLLFENGAIEPAQEQLIVPELHHGKPLLSGRLESGNILFSVQQQIIQLLLLLLDHTQLIAEQPGSIPLLLPRKPRYRAQTSRIFHQLSPLAAAVGG